jgi:5-methylcytosine-specific restriction endonuclease McrA
MPRAKKQCPKPECHKSGPHEHTGAWARKTTSISPEHRRNVRAFKRQFDSFVCGVRLVTGVATGDGCGRTIKNTGDVHQESTGAPEFDHVTPRARGGDDSKINYQVLCSTCHRAKTQRESNGLR